MTSTANKLTLKVLQCEDASKENPSISRTHTQPLSVQTKKLDSTETTEKDPRASHKTQLVKGIPSPVKRC